MEGLENENATLREQVQQWEQEGTHRQFESDKQYKQISDDADKWKEKFEESEAIQEKLLDEITKLKGETQALNDQIKAKTTDEIELKKKIKLLRRDLEKQKSS
jgi:predicted nuclease with TOPRIM domain